MRIIVLFALCRYAHSCAFISVIELPRIPAYCPKIRGWKASDHEMHLACEYNWCYNYYRHMTEMDVRQDGTTDKMQKNLYRTGL